MLFWILRKGLRGKKITPASLVPIAGPNGVTRLPSRRRQDQVKIPSPTGSHVGRHSRFQPPTITGSGRRRPWLRLTGGPGSHAASAPGPPGRAFHSVTQAGSV